VDILFLFHACKTRQWGWLRDVVVVACALAWVWMLLGVSPFAYDTKISFSLALIWVRFPLFYAALRYWVLRERRAFFGLAASLSVMLGLVAADTLWQYIFGVSLSGHVRPPSLRLSGPMDSVKVGIFMAKLLLPVAGIALAFAAQRGKYHVAACVLLFLACMAVVMLSGERTAFGSTVCGLLSIAALLIIAEPRTRIACVGGIVIFAALVAILFFTQEFVHKRGVVMYDTLLHYRHSDYGFLAFTGIQMGADHWPTGVGLRGFRELCPQYLDGMPLTSCNLHPHNPYIEWFVETGAVGLLLFIGIVAAMGREVLRVFLSHRGVQRCAPAVAVGVLTMNFFPFMGTQSFFSNWPALLLWYAVSVAIAASALAELPVDALKDKVIP
jgi:O-antigen ligase